MPAQNLIGNIRFAQGKLDEAERAYLKTLAINPNYAPAHNDLGNLYAKRGRVDSARRVPSRAPARPQSGTGEAQRRFFRKAVR